MSRVRVLTGFTAAFALGLAACGGDTTSSGDPLSEAEAAELAEALAEGGFAGFGALGSAPMGAPGEADANVTVTLNDTAPCEGGGTVAVNGTMSYDFNQTTGAGTIHFNYTVSPSGCDVTTSGGKVFTLTGDPNLKATGDFSFSETSNGSSFEGSLTYDGKFKWEASDGRAGACGVDLTANYNFTFSGTGSSGSATLTGSVCGVTVNRTISVSA